MSAATPLDAAAASGDRPRFFAALSRAELFVLLTEEAQGDRVSPEIFETEEGRFVLAFDREDRLASFTGQPAPYVALSGRALAEMLEGQGIGIALNPEVAPSSELLGADAVDWLHQMLTQSGAAGAVEERAQVTARPEEILPPEVPEALVAALDRQLASLSGQARSAYLVAARYPGGRRGHILAFVDPLAGAEAALTQAVQEALIFSDLDAAALDVAFFAARDGATARLAKVGLRFDLPEPERMAPLAPPGSDPDVPPKLR